MGGSGVSAGRAGGAAAPALAGVSLAAAGLLVAVAALDAFRGCRAAPNLTVTLPPVVRLTQDRPGNIEVRLGSRRRQAMTVRLALGLPPEIHSQEEAAVLLAGDTEWSRLAWPCAPRRRGRFQVRCARLETPSPWGFWATRRSFAVESEIRVYPNLLADRKSLAPLFLNRGSFGLHAQRQIGKGREFEKLREYIPGDSYDEIHWKATARRGHPITKVFQIERTQEVYLLLDCSRLSGRPLYRSTAPAASRRRRQARNGSAHPPRALHFGNAPAGACRRTPGRFFSGLSPSPTKWIAFSPRETARPITAPAGTRCICSSRERSAPTLKK